MNVKQLLIGLISCCVVKKGLPQTTGFLKALYFDITQDYEKVQNSQASVDPLPSFPQRPHITIVHHQNQEIDIGTVVCTKLQSLFGFRQFVCVYHLRKFIPCSSCNHRCQNIELLHHHKEDTSLLYSTCFQLCPLATTDRSSVMIVLSFLECHINEIIAYITFGFLFLKCSLCRVGTYAC